MARQQAQLHVVIRLSYDIDNDGFLTSDSALQRTFHTNLLMQTEQIACESGVNFAGPFDEMGCL